MKNMHLAPITVLSIILSIITIVLCTINLIYFSGFFKSSSNAFGRDIVTMAVGDEYKIKKTGLKFDLSKFNSDNFDVIIKDKTIVSVSELNSDAFTLKGLQKGATYVQFRKENEETGAYLVIVQ